MKCSYCLGTSFAKGRYDLAQVIKLQPVLIRNVPGSRCRQCGYIQVSAATMKKIETLLASGLPVTVTPSDVYDLESPIPSVKFAHIPPMRVYTDATKVAV